MDIPKELQRNPHFARYFRTWERNELSIVFIPLAQICREQGFLEMAREICEKGLSRHPSSVSGRLMLARIFMDMEDPDKAREIVDKVLEEYPAQQEARSLHDRIARSAPRAKEKKEEREEKDEQIPTTEAPSAMSSVPSPISPWENPTMAKIYADQGETRLAHQILDKILARDPENARAAELKRSITA